QVLIPGVPMASLGLGRNEMKLLPFAVGTIANAVRATASGSDAVEVPKSAIREPLPEVLATTHHASSVTSRLVSNKCPGREIHPLLSTMVAIPFAKATEVPTTVPFAPPTESVTSPELKL